ncbi:conserved hypothetical protein [Frankia canadensis]|uniref:Uncharacterized protein n=1 Tax=Frankia canadensis TaxID=1836972 RepID=A0A2I2L081_9ACTN|nr:hypothetical protein [Frankia canadensis]SNQ51331.1 conserved hypothetical protein [Frankia canadensis]SOU58621.1 conserved hypothetical protein [Frankia canadensis]
MSEPPLVPGKHLLSARRRVERAAAAALAELDPFSKQLAVAVDEPDDVDLACALQWAASSGITAAEAGEKLGVTMTESELVGWVSPWPVSARHTRGGMTGTSVTPTSTAADLAVDLADWLQTILADAGISDPIPPCPAHPHPMRPVVHEGGPWWECPNGGLVRPWPRTVAC